MGEHQVLFWKIRMEILVSSLLLLIIIIIIIIITVRSRIVAQAHLEQCDLAQ